MKEAIQKAMHWLAHKLHWNYVHADAQIENGEVVMYVRCNTCRKLKKL